MAAKTALLIAARLILPPALAHHGWSEYDSFRLLAYL